MSSAVAQNPPSEVDIVFVGGGAAGCVAAGRLAKANPDLQIAIVEAGIDNIDEATSYTPALYISHLAPTSTTANFYVSKEGKEVANRACIVPTGGMLGGGSSINFMMYTRGSASDYDDWKTEGWAFDDLLPVVKKTETNHLPSQAPKVHGDSGNLHVSYGGHQSNLGEEWIKAAQQADPKLPYSRDIQDYRTAHAVTNWGKWINPKTGRRSDTANGFVHPVVKEQSNLHVLCEQKTIRVLFDESGDEPRAVGVEYCHNPTARTPIDPENPPKVGETSTIKARKYVVVSAGAFGTPLILERSGVGMKEVLDKVGVKQVVDLDVGKQYDDHQLAINIYVVDESADTLDELLRGNPEVHAEAGPLFVKEGKGLLSTNAIDAGIKMRPTEEEVRSMNCPAFQKVWDEYYKQKPDAPVIICGAIATFLGDHALLPPNNKYMMCGVYDVSCLLQLSLQTNQCADFAPYNAMSQMHRRSRGHLHISSTDPFSAPDFDAGFMRDPSDMAPHIWGWKRARETARRMPSYRGELAPTNPKFAEDSPARCIGPDEAKALLASGKIEDLVYSEADNAAIAQWVRENVGTTWHSISTCPMKPRAEGGVVDARLNVYGTKGLKLADLSICPRNVASNTYSVALTVGEKAADLLAQDMGVKV
ncbi:BQ5605_C027g10336 [Microbotryum silenes-dioicae]|uniref:BQ5605_C027g10336 protein n=1 Tax=Microbotryum silenes-dioicae TaxID=796604 RepID=A0A2X0MRU8_9BASI|nr:BQ5605_C027g10336 [Microbotryum silenes-dioicae]